LRYANRDAVIVADGIDRADELETRLAQHIRTVADASALDDLSTAVLALNAVDRCFRQSGLWPGNIYVAGAGTLAAVLHLAQVPKFVHRKPETVVRKLAALELAYLFPIAGKFRKDEYDGQVQYRLNGWDRALATRLMAGRAGASRASALRLKSASTSPARASATARSCASWMSHARTIAATCWMLRWPADPRTGLDLGDGLLGELMTPIETLTNPGAIHWGIMLAQGWKGELAVTGRQESWPVARDWARRAGQLGFHGIWAFDHFQPYPARDDSPVLEAWTTLAALSQVTAKLLREAESRATMLLRQNLDTLARVIDLLLERKTIDGSDLAAIVGVPERPAEPEMVWAPRAVAMTPVEAEQVGASAANGKAAPVG
jgi:hypothetical protein